MFHVCKLDEIRTREKIEEALKALQDLVQLDLSKVCPKDEDSKKLRSEYLRFLVLKYVCNDLESNFLHPSNLIRECWKLHIQDINSYTTANDKIFKGFCLYDPKVKLLSKDSF